MGRNVYRMTLMFNECLLLKVVIDQHYKESHPEMSDDLILELVKELNGLKLDFEERRGDFFYFKREPLYLRDKPYRLVFVIQLGKDYLGVINAFRTKWGLK